MQFDALLCAGGVLIIFVYNRPDQLFTYRTVKKLVEVRKHNILYCLTLKSFLAYI